MLTMSIKVYFVNVVVKVNESPYKHTYKSIDTVNWKFFLRDSLTTDNATVTR